MWCHGNFRLHIAQTMMVLKSVPRKSRRSHSLAECPCRFEKSLRSFSPSSWAISWECCERRSRCIWWHYRCRKCDRSCFVVDFEDCCCCLRPGTLARRFSWTCTMSNWHDDRFWAFPRLQVTKFVKNLDKFQKIATLRHQLSWTLTLMIIFVVFERF